jgi:hypothetical protein
VPVVVLAHTHEAQDGEAAAGRRHLNTGTWSRLLPAGAPGCTYVVVRRGEAGPQAQLGRFDAQRRELMLPSPAAPPAR